MLALYGFLALGSHYAAAVSGESSQFSPDEVGTYTAAISTGAARTLIDKISVGLTIEAKGTLALATIGLACSSGIPMLLRPSKPSTITAGGMPIRMIEMATVLSGFKAIWESIPILTTSTSEHSIHSMLPSAVSRKMRRKHCLEGHQRRRSLHQTARRRGDPDYTDITAVLRR
jgi:hypothetical protein